MTGGGGVEGGGRGFSESHLNLVSAPLTYLCLLAHVRLGTPGVSHIPCFPVAKHLLVVTHRHAVQCLGATATLSKHRVAAHIPGQCYHPGMQQEKKGIKGACKREEYER